MAQTAGGEGMRVPRARIGVQTRRVAKLQFEVIAGRDADKDARPRAREFVRCYGGVLQGVPGDLQQNSVLRVHPLDFARNETEEVAVKSIDIVQEAAPP